MKPSGDYRMSGDQRIYAQCPSCGKANKCYQSDETGAWYCFSCQAKGIVSDEITRADDLRKKLFPQERHENSWPEMAMPEFKPLGNLARRWLRGRGITAPEQFGIVELEGSTRVLLPYHGPSGRIIYWSTRHYIDDGKPKYVTAPGRHPLYVLPEWRKHDEVVIVEGVLDAIAHYLATGIATIALGGKSLPNYLRSELAILAGDRRTVMLDSDAFGAAMKLAGDIGGKVELLPDGMDPADYYKGDVHERY